MKKASVLSIILCASTMLFSCNNNSNRLESFNIDSLTNYLNSLATYEVQYSKDKIRYNLTKETTSLNYTVDDDKEEYSYLDGKYYQVEGEKQVDKTEDVNDIIYYVVENFMYSYKKDYKDNKLVFVNEYKDETKENGYDHYYEYKTVYSTTESGESGYKYLINADHGYLLSKTVYGDSEILKRSGEINITTFKVK